MPQTAQINFTPSKEKSQVQVPKKFPCKTTAKRLHTDTTGSVNNCIHTSNPFYDQQPHEELQAMLNTDSTAPNSPIFKHLHHTHYFSVECEGLDHISAAQSQPLGVDGFAREEVVPLYIWNHKNASKDYKACIQQTGDQFGCIPLNDLKIYQGPEVTWKQIPPIIQAHKLIRQSGVPKNS